MYRQQSQFTSQAQSRAFRMALLDASFRNPRPLFTAQAGVEYIELQPLFTFL